MQTSILIVLIVCYVVVCRQNYLNLAKGSAHCRHHPGAWLAVVGGLLTIVLSVYVCYLMKPVDMLTFMVVYCTSSAPFYGSMLLGLLGKKRQLADMAEGQ